MTRLLRNAMRRFGRAQDGTMTVEACILMPFLFVLIVICVILFDSIRQQTLNHRSTYAVVDMLSRETAHIDPAYVGNARQMMAFLSRLEADAVSIRVSVARWDEDENRHVLMWSAQEGEALAAHTDASIALVADRLPIMVDDDQVVLVETLVDYDPPLAVGVAPRRIGTFTFASPRYAPQLLWCDDDCPVDPTGV